ncbi:MAG: hypothetical protein ACK4VZ_02170 [Paracoccaceae bacterium]
MTGSEAIRSSTPLVAKSFRAVKEHGEDDYDLKDGNRVFGTIVPVSDGFSVRFMLGGVKYTFLADSVKRGIDVVAGFAFLPKAISDLEGRISDVTTHGPTIGDHIFGRGGMDKDLLREQIIRDCNRNIVQLRSLYQECSILISKRKSG